MSDLKIWTFDQMRTPTLQRSLVRELTAPARESTPSPERTREVCSPLVEIVRNFSVAFYGPDLPCSLHHTAQPLALIQWARANVPAPDAALQCLASILLTTSQERELAQEGDGQPLAIPKADSSDRSPP